MVVLIGIGGVSGQSTSVNDREANPRQSDQSSRPRIFALVAGVANYKYDNSINDLRYTDDDAYRIYAFLKSCKGGCVDDENIAVLVDEAATKKNILETMNKIFSKAGPDDLLWFYFSGHGTEGAFVPYDFEADKMETTLLHHREVKAEFRKHNAKYKVVFADACHSGSIFSNRPVEAASASSGSPEHTVLIMMSSLPSEYSEENPTLREGVFTYYLLKGLKGVADRDKNSVVTLEELFPYVKANVLNFTQNKQTPFIEGNASRQMPLSFLR